MRRNGGSHRAWSVTLCLAFASLWMPSLCLAAPEDQGNIADASGSHPTPATEQTTLLVQPPNHSRALDNESAGRAGSFIIAPLPISSPAIGSGVIPVLGYIFRLRKDDTVSPPSVVGVAGLVTNNGTRGFAAYSDLYMKRDTYHVTAAYLRGNLNYDLYGIGILAGDAGRKLPLEQTGQVFRGEVLRRLGWDFFAGLRFWSGSSVVEPRGSMTSTDVQTPPDIGLHTTLRALGLRVHRDTTPNRFYPTAGSILDFTSDFFSQGLGSKYFFQSYRFSFNKYAGFSKRQVLAYNLFVCGTGGQPPFYGNCIYGTNSELRGYTAGRYLDRYMFATQLEYRLSLPKRFGVVGFGGIGEVVPGASQILRSRNFLPAGGSGVRFQLSKSYGVNLRADFARGKENWTWTMGVGEAF